MLDKEKQILVEWQGATIAYKAMVSMGITVSWAVDNYFSAKEKLLTITDPRVTALVKTVCSNPPDGYITKALHRRWVKWKAKVDAAEDKLLTISFEFGDAFPTGNVKH